MAKKETTKFAKLIWYCAKKQGVGQSALGDLKLEELYKAYGAGLGFRQAWEPWD
jgi:hypothetical protein